MAKHPRKAATPKSVRGAAVEVGEPKSSREPTGAPPSKPKRDLARVAMTAIDAAIREMEDAAKNDRKAFYARGEAPNGNALATQLRSNLEGVLPRLNALIIAGA